ncbi:hypothetical protein CD351_04150 [Erythrobacter sp. KY5]|uniref:hypothetical protein n=1 Tax=Erythrobacter sp. KY5 TaxID=2011159 RepID=UPI000DBEF971|nr:hypothetical protein [Erythrobacter sp. KY5]AWW73618.1 hypothetical protein CD351_04150 [Erythrobacter sp. KY5]
MSALSLALTAVLASGSPGAACDPLPGWEAVASEARGKYLVLGESHGTLEAPAATAEYVCAVAEDGPVLLAIEFSSPDNDGFQRAWAKPHDEFRTALFAEVPDWGARQDGVASLAMLEMLERLHALKEAGRDIDIVAFNGANGDAQRAAFAGLPGQEPHEAAQAANIREAAQSRDYAHVVVLVGGFHAEKLPAVLGQTPTRPMANLLAPANRVVSLVMHSDGGESWSCQLAIGADFDPTEPVTSDMVSCKAHPAGPSRPPMERGFHLSKVTEPQSYDGVFALGKISASPPPTND